MTTFYDEKTKRHRTSPRVKILDEVCAMISQDLEEFQEEQKETGTDNSILIAAFSNLKERVSSLLEEKKAARVGRWYVGIKEDGTKVKFTHHSKPTAHTHGKSSKYGFVSVFGSFNTSAGASFRVDHSLEQLKEKLVEMPVIF